MTNNQLQYQKMLECNLLSFNDEYQLMVSHII